MVTFKPNVSATARVNGSCLITFL